MTEDEKMKMTEKQVEAIEELLDMRDRLSAAEADKMYSGDSSAADFVFDDLERDDYTRDVLDSLDNLGLGKPWRKFSAMDMPLDGEDLVEPADDDARIDKMYAGWDAWSVLQYDALADISEFLEKVDKKFGTDYATR